MERPLIQPQTGSDMLVLSISVDDPERTFCFPIAGVVELGSPGAAPEDLGTLKVIVAKSSQLNWTFLADTTMVVDVLPCFYCPLLIAGV
jgi:hypothetical protein